MTLKTLSGIIALMLATSGCDRLPIVGYTHFVNIPQSGIPQNWVYDFNTENSDSTEIISRRHNVVIIVRYNYDCPSREIILNIEETSLQASNPDSTQMRIRLFDKKGKPLGKGSYGIFEISDTIHRNFSIPEGYTVSLSSPLEANLTTGIKSLGVVVKD